MVPEVSKNSQYDPYRIKDLIIVKAQLSKDAVTSKSHSNLGHVTDLKKHAEPLLEHTDQFRPDAAEDNLTDRDFMLHRLYRSRTCGQIAKER